MILKSDKSTNYMSLDRKTLTYILTLDLKNFEGLSWSLQVGRLSKLKELEIKFDFDGYFIFIVAVVYQKSCQNACLTTEDPSFPSSQSKRKVNKPDF